MALELEKILGTDTGKAAFYKLDRNFDKIKSAMENLNGDAKNISFDPTETDLTAEDVQSAIEELYSTNVSLEAQINDLDADVVAHKAESVSQLFGQNPHGIPDYEEGTFTPVIQAHDANITNQYSVQTGYYVRQGNTVFVTGRVALSTLGSGWTGESRVGITGLPFVASFRGAGYPGMISDVDLTGIVNPNIEIYPNQDIFIIRNTINNAPLQFLLYNKLTNTSAFQFSFSYKI